jgi:hypothetical protein
MELCGMKFYINSRNIIHIKKPMSWHKIDMSPEQLKTYVDLEERMALLNQAYIELDEAQEYENFITELI